MPLTGALFVTNPRRRRHKAKARRNSGVRRNRAHRAYSTAKKRYYRAHKMKDGTKAQYSERRKKAKAAAAAAVASWRASNRKLRAKMRARPASKRQLRRRRASATAAFSQIPAGAAALQNPRRRRRYSRRNPRLVKGSAAAKAWGAAMRARRGLRKRKTATIHRTRGAARTAALASYYGVPKSAVARRNRRNGYARPRRNTGVMSIPGMSTVTGLISRVPFGIGPTIAAAVPVALLALGGAYVNAKFVSPYVSRYIPTQAAAFSGTLTGGAVAAAAYAVARFMPGMLGSVAKTIAAASALAGVLSDAARFAQSKGLISGLSGIASMNGIAAMNGLALSGYGDGGAYELSGVASLAGSHYADATNADAAYSGADLSAYEGTAALNGEGAWFGTFGVPPVRAVRRQGGPNSRHAGREGHKWGWLIRLVGFTNFQKIAALPPQERVAVIMGLRKQALESLPVLLSESQVAIPSAITATAFMQNDSATAGLGGYGALMFAGHA